MANNNAPLVTSPHATVISDTKGRLDDLTKGNDSSEVVMTNPPDKALRWTGAASARKLQQYSAATSTWSDYGSKYAITVTLSDSAGHITGGGAGQLLYQSGAGVTSKLAAGNAAQMLVGGAGAPAWADYAPIVRGVLLTGLSTAADAVIAAGDTLLDALGRLQAQVSKRLLAVGGLIQSYKEKVVSATGISGAYAVNCANGNIFSLTAGGNVTLSFSNVPTGDDHFAVTLYLGQDATGGRTWTFPAEVNWGANGAPVFSTVANRVDVVTLSTRDAGATWFGFTAGTGF